MTLESSEFGIKFLQDCEELSTKSPIKDEVIGALINLWRTFQNENEAKELASSDRYLESLLICSSRLIFSVQYSKNVSSSRRQELKEIIAACGDVFSDSPHRRKLCKGISTIVENPWTAINFKKVVDKGSSKKDRDSDSLWETEGWVLLETRMDYLARANGIDQMSSLLDVLVEKGHKIFPTSPPNTDSESFHPYQFSYQKYLDYLEVFAMLQLDRKDQSKVKTVIETWNKRVLLDVISSLKEKVANVASPRLFPKLKMWRNVSDFAESLARQATLKSINSNGLLLEEFFIKWMELLYCNNKAIESAIDEMITNIDNRAVTECLYTIAKSIIQKLGITAFTRSKYVELFVTAMARDISKMEELKSSSVDKTEAIKDFDKKRSSHYLELAVFFKDYPRTAHGCLLTAFSLNPCEELYRLLFPSSICDTENENINIGTDNDHALQTELIGLSEVNFEKYSSTVIDEDLQLGDTLQEDVYIVITNPRYNGFVNLNSPEQLKEVCCKLLESKSVSVIENKILDHLDVDYEKYKDLKPQYDPEDDGIEKGYRHGERLSRRNVLRTKSVTRNVLKGSCVKAKKKAINRVRKLPLPGKESEVLANGHVFRAVRKKGRPPKVKSEDDSKLVGMANRKMFEELRQKPNICNISNPWVDSSTTGGFYNEFYQTCLHLTDYPYKERTFGRNFIQEDRLIKAVKLKRLDEVERTRTDFINSAPTLAIEDHNNSSDNATPTDSTARPIGCVENIHGAANNSISSLGYVTPFYQDPFGGLLQNLLLQYQYHRSKITAKRNAQTAENAAKNQHSRSKKLINSVISEKKVKKSKIVEEKSQNAKTCRKRVAFKTQKYNEIEHNDSLTKVGATSVKDENAVDTSEVSSVMESVEPVSPPLEETKSVSVTKEIEPVPAPIPEPPQPVFAGAFQIMGTYCKTDGESPSDITSISVPAVQQSKSGISPGKVPTEEQMQKWEETVRTVSSEQMTVNVTQAKFVEGGVPTPLMPTNSLAASAQVTSTIIKPLKTYTNNKRRLVIVKNWSEMEKIDEDTSKNTVSVPVNDSVLATTKNPSASANGDSISLNDFTETSLSRSDSIYSVKNNAEIHSSLNFNPNPVTQTGASFTANDIEIPLVEFDTENFTVKEKNESGERGEKSALRGVSFDIMDSDTSLPLVPERQVLQNDEESKSNHDSEKSVSISDCMGKQCSSVVEKCIDRSSSSNEDAQCTSKQTGGEVEKQHDSIKKLDVISSTPSSKDENASHDEKPGGNNNCKKETNPYNLLWMNQNNDGAAIKKKSLKINLDVIQRLKWMTVKTYTPNSDNKNPVNHLAKHSSSSSSTNTDEENKKYEVNYKESKNKSKYEDTSSKNALDTTTEVNSETETSSAVNVETAPLVVKNLASKSSSAQQQDTEGNSFSIIEMCKMSGENHGPESLDLVKPELLSVKESAITTATVPLGNTQSFAFSSAEHQINEENKDENNPTEVVEFKHSVCSDHFLSTVDENNTQKEILGSDGQNALDHRNCLAGNSENIECILQEKGSENLNELSENKKEMSSFENGCQLQLINNTSSTLPIDTPDQYEVGPINSHIEVANEVINNILDTLDKKNAQPIDESFADNIEKEKSKVPVIELNHHLSQSNNGRSASTTNDNDSFEIQNKVAYEVPFIVEDEDTKENAGVNNSQSDHFQAEIENPGSKVNISELNVEEVEPEIICLEDDESVISIFKDTDEPLTSTVCTSSPQTVEEIGCPHPQSSVLPDGTAGDSVTSRPITPLSVLEDLIHTKITKKCKPKRPYEEEEQRIKVSKSVLKHVEQYGPIPLRKLLVCVVKIKRLSPNELPEKARNQLSTNPVMKRSNRLKLRKMKAVQMLQSVYNEKSSTVEDDSSGKNADESKVADDSADSDIEVIEEHPPPSACESNSIQMSISSDRKQNAKVLKVPQSRKRRNIEDGPGQVSPESTKRKRSCVQEQLYTESSGDTDNDSFKGDDRSDADYAPMSLSESTTDIEDDDVAEYNLQDNMPAMPPLDLQVTSPDEVYIIDGKDPLALDEHVVPARLGPNDDGNLGEIQPQTIITVSSDDEGDYDSMVDEESKKRRKMYEDDKYEDFPSVFVAADKIGEYVVTEQPERDVVNHEISKENFADEMDGSDIQIVKEETQNKPGRSRKNVIRTGIKNNSEYENMKTRRTRSSNTSCRSTRLTTEPSTNNPSSLSLDENDWNIEISDKVPDHPAVESVSKSTNQKPDSDKATESFNCNDLFILPNSNVELDNLYDVENNAIHERSICSKLNADTLNGKSNESQNVLECNNEGEIEILNIGAVRDTFFEKERSVVCNNDVVEDTHHRSDIIDLVAATPSPEDCSRYVENNETQEILLTDVRPNLSEEISKIACPNDMQIADQVEDDVHESVNLTNSLIGQSHADSEETELTGSNLRFNVESMANEYVSLESDVNYGLCCTSERHRAFKSIQSDSDFDVSNNTTEIASDQQPYTEEANDGAADGDFDQHLDPDTVQEETRELRDRNFGQHPDPDTCQEENEELRDRNFDQHRDPDAAQKINGELKDGDSVQESGMVQEISKELGGDGDSNSQATADLKDKNEGQVGTDACVVNATLLEDASRDFNIFFRTGNNIRRTGKWTDEDYLEISEATITPPTNIDGFVKIVDKPQTVDVLVGSESEKNSDTVKIDSDISMPLVVDGENAFVDNQNESELTRNIELNKNHAAFEEQAMEDTDSISNKIGILQDYVSNKEVFVSVEEDTIMTVSMENVALAKEYSIDDKQSTDVLVNEIEGDLQCPSSDYLVRQNLEDCDLSSTEMMEALGSPQMPKLTLEPDAFKRSSWDSDEEPPLLEKEDFS